MTRKPKHYGHFARTMIELRYLPEELAMRWAGSTWVNECEMTFDLKVMGVTKYITMPEKYPHDLYSFFLNLRKADGTPSDASKPHDMGWDTGVWDDGSYMHFDDCNGLIRKYMEKEDQANWKMQMVLAGVSTDSRRDMWKARHGHE
jgi:hypothetical protein|tara:strand:- start:713 stop:1150 length:438 start_codon:yes stop_codon:yes gene_type:complete